MSTESPEFDEAAEREAYQKMVDQMNPQTRVQLDKFQARLRLAAEQNVLNQQQAAERDAENQVIHEHLLRQASGDQTVAGIQWSRILTKAEAAKLHNNGVAVSNPTLYFARLIKKKLLTTPIGGGKQFRFVISEFPVNAHDKMR